jgi:FkbH-like protein
MKQVKLVIWDLDETFWEGTLSEGPIVYQKKNHDIVIALTQRGIVNSISSKNNFDDSRSCLEKHGIWEYFVFPKIQWQPKGQLVSALIEEMQLRAENVLFIDDNHLNLEEAKFYNPGIQTAGPEILGNILDLEACKGKNDSSLSRLNQYKLLENKLQDQKTTLCSNDEFLRSSNICIEIVKDCRAESERILELINRTNQLNYTKQRLSQEDLTQLLDNPRIEKGHIRVTDKYGDYGICGFYAKEDAHLSHFLFSCRILNMGIEHWLYQKLGCPAIDVAGEVASGLHTESTPDWIHEGSRKKMLAEDDETVAKKKQVGIMVKSGCDMLQTKNYLIKSSLLDAETNYVSTSKGTMVNNSHTEILRRSNRTTLSAYGEVIDKVQFFDQDAFKTRFFSNEHDVYIYSALEDYTRALYRYEDTDFIIAFDDFLVDATQRKNWSKHLEGNKKHFLDAPFLEWFSTHFTFLGAIPIDSFRKNIIWLSNQIDSHKLLIILNGSEVEYTPKPESQRWLHHKKMNDLLEDAVKDRDNVVICDVREFLSQPEDHSNNIRHYNRKAYFQIAQKINSVIEDRYHVSASFWEKQWNLFKITKKVTSKLIRKKVKHTIRKIIPAG